MSTKFTQKETPMVDSLTLQLTQNATKLNDVLVKYLSKRLVDKGYTSITPSLLSFLSVLECGVNYGSEIARNLGVTRQMVAKTVKELCALAYLEQIAGIGKQKEICFTKTGELLMSDARQILAEIDGVLFSHLSDDKIANIISDLNTITSVVDEKFNSTY